MLILDRTAIRPTYGPLEKQIYVGYVDKWRDKVIV